jgi:hypothetical protein
MKKKNIEPCIDDPEIAMEEILVAEAIPHIDFEDTPMDEPKDEFAAEEVPIAEPSYECAEEVSIAEPPYECAEEVAFAEPTAQAASEKTYIAISKDLPVTKEFSEESCTGSGSMLQEPQEW